MKKALLGFMLFLLVACAAQRVRAQHAYLDSCLRILPLQKEDTIKVRRLNSIAWEISFQDLQKGLDYIKQADSLSRKLGYEKSFATIDNTYGSIYTDLGMHNEAMVHLLHGIKIAEKYHEDHELANLLSNLAVLQQRRNELKKATSSYKEAIAILLRNKDSLRLFGMMNNLASNYYEQHNLDSAIYYYTICMQYNISAKKELSLAYNYLNVSDIYRDRNNIPKAIQYIESAEQIARSKKNTYLLSYALAQKADILIGQANFPKALQVLEEALAIARSSGDLEVIQNCEQKLSNVYADSLSALYRCQRFDHEH
jgi:tetratricopeptide (TPR) repeat protein